MAAATYVAAKDAPIVAAAQHAQVDMLVSLDSKHLVGAPGVEEASGVRILLPAVALQEIRRHLGA